MTVAKHNERVKLDSRVIVGRSTSACPHRTRDAAQMSITTSPRGEAQQIKTFPSRGGSSGSGWYAMGPEISPLSHL